MLLVLYVPGWNEVDLECVGTCAVIASSVVNHVAHILAVKMVKDNTLH